MVQHDPDEWWVDINFEGLAGAFQSIFKEIIVLDESRLQFWIENRDRLERPIYVKAIVSAIHEQVKLKQFDKLDLWFDFCEWVLSHPDQRREEVSIVAMCPESIQTGKVRVERWAILLRLVWKRIVNIPITEREHLVSLLDKLCTQYDRRLDNNEPVFLNRDDQLTEAINNTRSRALKDLVDFGYWVRRQLEDNQADISEVFTILEKRLDSECECTLKLPEYALLGLHYGRIYGLNQEWAVRHKSDFFPQENLRAWKEAFGNFLRYNRPHKQVFDIVRSDIEFALKNIDKFKIGSHTATNLTDKLGEHLFCLLSLGYLPS